MLVTEHHLNAGGVCQGGAYFTLAGLENNIVFLKSARVGDTLIAEATEVYNHHKIPYVDVRVTNQHGDLCCVVTGLAYRKNADLPIDALE